MQERNRGRSKALIVSVLTRFAFIFSMQAIPPLLPMMIGEFGLSFTVASSLMWLVAVPGVFLSLLGSILTEKYGVKPMLVFGLSIAVASSLLFLLPGTLVVLQLSRLVLGVGGALSVVAASTLLFQWFAKERLGLAMGLFTFCMPLGTVLAFNVLGVLAINYGWRTSILITVVVNAVALAACALFARESSNARLDKVTFAPFRNADIWLLGLGWALFNMAALGYTTWGKTIFVRYYGLSMEFAGLLASMIMLVSFVQPLTGFVSDMLGQRRTLPIVSCILMFVVLLLFPYSQSDHFLLIAVVLGVIVAFAPPALFALSGEILGPGKGALGLGVMNTFLNFGIVFGPLTLGYVLDLTDSSYVSFFAMAAFSLLAALLVAFRQLWLRMRRLNSRVS